MCRLRTRRTKLNHHSIKVFQAHFVLLRERFEFFDTAKLNCEILARRTRLAWRSADSINPPGFYNPSFKPGRDLAPKIIGHLKNANNSAEMCVIGSTGLLSKSRQERFEASRNARSRFSLRLGQSSNSVANSQMPLPLLSLRSSRCHSSCWRRVSLAWLSFSNSSARRSESRPADSNLSRPHARLPAPWQSRSLQIRNNAPKSRKSRSPDTTSPALAQIPQDRPPSAACSCWTSGCIHAAPLDRRSRLRIRPLPDKQ